MREYSEAVTGLLRTSAAVRSVSYLGAMVAVLIGSSIVHRRYTANIADHPHIIALPGVIGITYLFARLHPDDVVAWTRTPSRDNVEQCVAGLVLGAAASASVLGIEGALGWVSAPAWGWNDGKQPAHVIAVAALTAAQEVPVIINEELVFRGYGLDMLREAFGLPAAVALSTLLFARYHGPGWRNLLGLSAFGLFLTFLRLRTGSLWLPAGAHLAWNLVQISIFGPSDSTPSLRPLQVHGPREWTGKPGTAEWGWFGVLAVVGLAAVAGVELWRHQRG